MNVLVLSAIKYPNGDIITGRRHGDVIRTQAFLGIRTVGEGCVQGFVDNADNFYTRKEAKVLALENGQISKDHKGELYSEDLWPGNETTV